VSASGSNLIVNGTLVCGTVTQSGGSLGVGASLSASQTIRVDAGVLQIPSVLAGLYEGLVNGAFNQTDSMSSNITVQLSTRMADTNVKPPWLDQATFIYAGFLWNRASTNVNWTFGENVDDNVLLKIDGATVINGGASWNTPTIGTINLAPGAHIFEARFANGGGGAGWVNSSWWTTNNLGFGVDYLGRNDTNIANYVALADPGDGSLLTRNAVSGGMTNRLGAGTSVELGAAGVLDLGTNTYSQTLANLGGSGIVSNGALLVNGSISPGGADAIGTLTVASCALLSGTLRVDVAADGSCDRLAVVGGLNLSGLSLEVANPAQLNSQKTYTVATVSGAATGAFAFAAPDSRWHVRTFADGSVRLVCAGGTLVGVR
jgi:hypothetical protein